MDFLETPESDKLDEVDKGTESFTTERFTNTQCDSVQMRQALC